MLRRRQRHPSLRTKRKKFAGHLGFVRSFQCLIADHHRCDGPVDPHHLQDGYTADIPSEERPGIGKKAHDKWTVPLCRLGAHREIHSIGQVEFEEKYGIELMPIARELQRRSPFRKGWEHE